MLSDALSEVKRGRGRAGLRSRRARAARSDALFAPRRSGSEIEIVCGLLHRVLVGTWGNVGFSAAIALLVMPAILYFHPVYTLQTVPPLFFVGMVGFLALAGYQAYRIKQFDSAPPIAD